MADSRASSSASGSSDSEMTSAAATRAVRKILDDAEVGNGDYDVHSHKTDDGVVTTVTVNGWGPPSLTKYIETSLNNLDGASVRRSGREFTITFG